MHAPAVPPPLSTPTRLAYGLGAIAYAVKDNGFSYFLLIFYSQVMGLDARLVGIAVTLALVLDALSDPVVGTWSDNLRSRLGRRHPFMYAAALPTALAFWMLWQPPQGLSQMALFGWLLAFAVATRLAISFFETPSTAMAPELVDGYDARSGLLAWRFYFGWTGGNMMTVMMFGLVFPAFVTAAIPNGQFNPEAYVVYGAVGGLAIFLAIMVSAVGTHSRIPFLKPPPERRQVSFSRLVAETRETLGSRSFGALFVAAIFGAIASGLAASLAFYLYTYFWRFSSEQIALLTFGIFLSAIIGGVAGPLASRTLGKKSGAIILGFVAFIGAPLPILLKLMGLMPGGSADFWIVLVVTIVDVGLIICFQILTTAMMSDLVEEAELRTGRRSEGLFFAAASFIRKLTTGIGVFVASLLLGSAGLAAGASPAEVPLDVSNRLAALYVPTVLALWMAMVAAIGFFRLSRADHDANLAALAARRAGSAGAA
jgi:Na+/melibiose symporter-like transporter